ncbi:hypothetical protein EDC04DRAFT_2900363 [Pisolithus marmoratus]|nr:hypothetical protein EDC04DRAFT_2900363 [Pisolithus marmoratus]
MPESSCSLREIPRAAVPSSDTDDSEMLLSDVGSLSSLWFCCPMPLSAAIACSGIGSVVTRLLRVRVPFSSPDGRARLCLPCLGSCSPPLAYTVMSLWCYFPCHLARGHVTLPAPLGPSAPLRSNGIDCNVQTVSGDKSSLPPSLPLEDHSDDSDPNGEETVPPPRQGHQMYPKLQNKGKGRALDVKDVDVADNSDCKTPPPNFKKLGNLSKMALEEIQAFVKDIKTTAEELGQWHGWSTCDILVAAGFGVKPSHTKLNEANLFHSWYWAMQPKPGGADRDAVNNLIMKEYNSLMKDIPKDDPGARREKLKAVYEWSKSSSIIPTNCSVKSIAARVENAKMQFSGLAEAWSNLKDIEIVGAVMYVRQDPAGHQTSGIFGGSEVIRNFINANSIDVQALLDKYTSIFKCLRNGDGVDAGMMKEKLLAALRDLQLTHGIEVSDPQKVGWHRLLEFMQKCHLTVINWPLGVSPLGPGFDHKKLKARPLRQLVVPYLWRKLGPMYDGWTDDEEEQGSLDDAPEIEIKCWSQDIINISDNNPLSGNVPLVKAADGTVLWKVSDDPEWQKSRQERDCQQQQDAEVR